MPPGATPPPGTFGGGFGGGNFNGNPNFALEVQKEADKHLNEASALEQNLELMRQNGKKISHEARRNRMFALPIQHNAICRGDSS